MQCTKGSGADWAVPNPQCPPYFKRMNVSARSANRALLTGLREMHTRQALLDQASGQPSTSSIYSERPRSASQQQITGVTIDFINEVARHVPEDMTVAQLSSSILDKASQPFRTSFQSIPGLVHGKYRAPADYVVSFDAERTKYHQVAKALAMHARMKGGSKSTTTYWLGCFATNRHQSSISPQAVLVESARAAAVSAKGCLLMLDSSASVLTMAWPLQDLLWTLKAHPKVRPSGGDGGCGSYRNAPSIRVCIA